MPKIWVVERVNKRTGKRVESRPMDEAEARKMVAEYRASDNWRNVNMRKAAHWLHR
jgi:hypothetical protein